MYSQVHRPYDPPRPETNFMFQFLTGVVQGAVDQLVTYYDFKQFTAQDEEDEKENPINEELIHGHKSDETPEEFVARIGPRLENKGLTAPALQMVLEDRVRDLITHWKERYGWQLKPTTKRLTLLETFGADKEARGIDDYTEVGPAAMFASLCKQTYVPVDPEAEAGTEAATPFVWNAEDLDARVRFPADAIRKFNPLTYKAERPGYGPPRPKRRSKSKKPEAYKQEGYHVEGETTVSEAGPSIPKKPGKKLSEAGKRAARARRSRTRSKSRGRVPAPPPPKPPGPKPPPPPPGQLEPSSDQGDI